MTHSVFISYSHSESPFADDLLDVLEDNDVEVWADYRSPVPAMPWLDQVVDKINNCDVFLLVISRTSLASNNVEMEYRRAIEQGKRIILLILEAVPLPPALQDCEWVDFRGWFGWRYRQLLRRLGKPGKQSPPPQKGFKAPFVAWLSSWMSWLAVLISIPAWWMIYIPILLIPLPFRILRRDFDYYRVRFALLTLPVVLLFDWLFFLDYPLIEAVTSFCLLAGILISPLMLLLLSSKQMRRWGKPYASVPRSAKPFPPEVKQPEPVTFFIEHALEDKKYAEVLARGLKKYGHTQVMSAGEARADFVLISRYKTSTLIHPEKRVVYPVIIQDALITDRSIQRLPWLDFRRGIRHLDSLARLLPEPAELLRELGVAPISEQTLHPRIIQILDFFLVLLGFFSVGAWLPLTIGFGLQFLQSPEAPTFLAVNAMLSALILLAVFLSRGALLARTGRLASLGSLVISILWIGFLGFAQCFYILNTITDATTLAGAISAAENDLRNLTVLFFPINYVLGLIMIGFFSLWNWGDLTRWSPARGK